MNESPIKKHGLLVCVLICAAICLRAVIAQSVTVPAPCTFTGRDSLAVRVTFKGNCWFIPPEGGKLSLQPDVTHACRLTTRQRYLPLQSIIKCDGPGSCVTLIYEIERRDTLRVTASEGWFPIVLPARPSKLALVAMAQWAHMLNIGGRSRASMQDGVVWPSSSVEISLSLASIRWNVPATAPSVTIAIEAPDALGPPFTRVVPAGEGRYAGEDLQRFLRNSAKNGSAAFMLQGGPAGAAGWKMQAFRIMSPAADSELGRELAGAEHLSPIERCLMRADVLWQKGLVAEAGDEYEAAFALDTTDVQVLLRAAHARRTTGERDRYRALVRRLPPGVALP